MRYDEKLRSAGAIKWLLTLSGLAVFAVSVPASIQGVLTASLSTWERVGIAAGGLFGLAASVWMITAHIRVQVTDTTLTASMWPLMRRRIALRDIRDAQSVRIDPLRDYGGWGIKGKRDNLLLGMSGNEGVRIDYGQGKRLVILTEDPHELLQALDTSQVTYR